MGQFGASMEEFKSGGGGNILSDEIVGVLIERSWINDHEQKG